MSTQNAVGRAHSLIVPPKPCPRPNRVPVHIGQGCPQVILSQRRSLRKIAQFRLTLFSRLALFSTLFSAPAFVLFRLAPSGTRPTPYRPRYPLHLGRKMGTRSP